MNESIKSMKSTKTSITDFLMNLADIEKGLWGTFKSMTFDPQKVICADLNSTDQFVSPFKYLTFSVFISITLMTLFFKTDTIGGKFYQAWLDYFIATGEIAKSATGEEKILNVAHFNQLFLTITSYYSWTYKFGVFVSIASGSFVTARLFKKNTWNFSQHILINTRVFSQVLLYSSILSLPLFLWPIGFWNLQYWHLMFQFIFGFYLFRKILKNHYDKYNMQAIKITLYSIALSSIFNLGTGIIVGFISEIHYPVWN